MRNSAIALMVATLALAACGTKNDTTTVTGNGMVAHNDMAMNSMGSNEMKADKKAH